MVGELNILSEVMSVDESIKRSDFLSEGILNNNGVVSTGKFSSLVILLFLLIFVYSSLIVWIVVSIRKGT